MKKLELLAPARNAATAIDAINHGADAIYMGATKFGAREQATNNYTDIEKVIEYAHLFDVKVYVTVNTIFFDNEEKQIRDILIDLWRLGVDAIIIQDTGILEMDLPPICFHMSTQANNSTLERIKFWGNTGISRVILARELTLTEIAEIRKNTTLELEAFIHGALCVSYSGNCYMSYDMINRSANRGNCAQPCRFTYNLTDSEGKIIKKNSHLLSLSDLDTSLILSDLIKAGISSFKIEGRLKDSTYVKNITAHYNNLLNNFISKNPGYQRASKGICTIGFNPDPEKSFNRGSSTYFYKGRTEGLINEISPKSMGKYIGKVTKCGNNWFSINSNIKLVNGDGICFQYQGELLGTQIVGKSEKGYLPQNIDGIKAGTEIYRNRDHEFIKQVEKSNSSRKIPCDIRVNFTAQKIVVIAKSDDVEVEKEVAFTEIAQNQAKAREVWQTQLSKLGDTCFILQSVEIEGDTVPHIPISAINSIRREITTDLENKIRSLHLKNRDITKIKVSDFYKSTVGYQENVSNSLAQQFYRKRGVSVIENAFEVEKPKSDEYTVMTTKYCIMFELGMCLKKTNKQDLPKFPLFLTHKERKYKLEFDCNKCQMIINRVKS